MKIKGKNNSNWGKQDAEEKYKDERSKELLNLFLHGVPGVDRKGHSAPINIRVRPALIDVIEGIHEKAPKGWFKSKSALLRSLIAVGCHVAIEIMEQNVHEVTELREILNQLNRIAATERQQELLEEVNVLQKKILASSIKNKNNIVIEMEQYKTELKKVARYK